MRWMKVDDVRSNKKLEEVDATIGKWWWMAVSEEVMCKGLAVAGEILRAFDAEEEAEGRVRGGRRK